MVLFSCASFITIAIFIICSLVDNGRQAIVNHIIIPVVNTIHLKSKCIVQR